MHQPIHRSLKAHHTRRTAALALVAIVALLLSACGAAGRAGENGTQEADASARLAIVTTTNVLGNVVREVAGDAADVTTLMPPGSDPHSFEASAAQLAQMQDADLVVANGAGLEQQLEDALAETAQAGVPVFRATDHIATLTFAGHDEHGDKERSAEEEPAESEEHKHGSVDPHFWMDPTRMAEVARALGVEVGKLAGDTTAVADRADAYAQRLAGVDVETQDVLAAVPAEQRKLVTNHEAFGYFAEHYGFEIVGTVIPSVTTGAEPSAQDLQELARIVEKEQVSAIFAENTAPQQLAETLAQEVGADIAVVELYSDSLGAEGSDAPTYVDMLRTNAQRVSGALGG